MHRASTYSWREHRLSPPTGRPSSRASLVTKLVTWVGRSSNVEPVSATRSMIRLTRADGQIRWPTGQLSAGASGLSRWRSERFRTTSAQAKTSPDQGFS